jgi:hypothetical protein
MGGDQPMGGQEIPGKTWARARSSYPGDAVWQSSTLDLPATAKDARVKLLAVEFEEQSVRKVLVGYGVPDLPPPPAPPRPRQRSGGHNMSAHGAVISAVVIELLKRPLHEVAALTEKTVAEDLDARFKAFNERRESISLENRLRIARQVLKNVIHELQERARGQSPAPGSVK